MHNKKILGSPSGYGHGKHGLVPQHLQTFTCRETHFIRADPIINEFFDQISLLPLNRAARISFVDHFHLRIENWANALISYIRDLSLPSPNDKRSALSRKWHLATVRRNLSLQQDSTYGIVLARADQILPDFAEFVVHETTPVGRHY